MADRSSKSVWSFLMTDRVSPSIKTSLRPRAIPRSTACLHATASIANDEAPSKLILKMSESGGHHTPTTSLFSATQSRKACSIVSFPF
ncbi:1,4-alpha-glucan-branching enzyme [Gossypium australe]|uniref:1,4-alpha-glucan-branching enzyme n=1 Tax=Gossypium australe TaxID=47621 RepID=A0A5B6WE12_9ROSI|nr:1,4-alpha-glucan-branching enzyme [Gossypium australe]